MSAFQPSEHSHYGDLGVLGLEKLEWSDLNPFSSSVSSATSSSTSATPSPTSAPAATSSSGPASGTYAEGGYTYSYNAVDKSIQIVLSPKSATPTAVPAGSTAYNAILAQIKSGVAAPVAASTVKAQRAAKAVSSGGSSASPAEPPPGLDLEVAFYQKPWFPYAVLGTVTVIGVLAVLLWPSKKKEHVAAPAPRRQRQIERKPEYDEEYEAEPA